MCLGIMKISCKEVRWCLKDSGGSSNGLRRKWDYFMKAACVRPGYQPQVLTNARRGRLHQWASFSGKNVWAGCGKQMSSVMIIAADICRALPEANDVTSFVQ